MRLLYVSTLTFLAFGCTPKWANDTAAGDVANDDATDSDEDEGADGAEDEDTGDDGGSDGFDDGGSNGGEDGGTNASDEGSDGGEDGGSEGGEDGDGDGGEDGDSDGSEDGDGDGGEDGGEDGGSDGDEDGGDDGETDACESIDDILTEDLGESIGAEVVWGYSDEVDDDLSSECFGDDPDAGDALYRWTVPESGCYYINTEGSDFDTVLSFRDTCTLEETRCHDDIDPGEYKISEIEDDFEAGTELLISVDKWEYDEEGLFVLNIDKSAGAVSPDEDIGMVTGDFAVLGYIDGSSRIEGECADRERGSGPEKVYQWSPPSDGCWQLSTE